MTECLLPVSKGSFSDDNVKLEEICEMHKRFNASNKNMKNDELEICNATKSLSEVQQYLLDMLKQLIEMFDANDIKYYVIGGTLLGAIRHKGFIPWDDDVDLAMPRDDYEKFIKICKDQLPETFKLRTWDGDSYHHYYFARVVDTRYKILRQGSIENREEELWIDLFPLDGLPQNPIARSWHKLKLLYLKLWYHLASFNKLNLKRPNRPLYQRAIIRIYRTLPIKSHKNYKDILQKIDLLLKKVPLEASDYYMEFMGSSIPFRETLTKEQYGKGAYYDFEDIKVVGPVDAHFYLTHVYGDWRKLPPENERNYHMATFVKTNYQGVEG